MFTKHISRRYRKGCELYHNGKYERVLRVYDRLYKPGKYKIVVYQNILRIACLIKMNDEVWKSEYKTFLNEEGLSLLETDDQWYIQHQFAKLAGLSSEEMKFYLRYNLAKVSGLTKKLFPIN